MIKINEKPALSITDLYVNYNLQPALSNIHLDIPQGLLIGIIGPNGAGKSTLLKTALGLIKPSRGKVEFFGQSIEKLKGLIGYVPQRETVDWDFPVTVHDLVLMGRYSHIGLFKRPSSTDYQITQECLSKVGLASYSQRQIRQLSCGQQQKAFIARAFAQQATVYFMDEPFAGVDLATETLLITQEQKKTVFVVHHDLHNIDIYYDWIIMLNTELIAVGNIKDVFTAENKERTFRSRNS
jgi:manganese/zinc/iron transport system ATP- binding protein